MSELDWMHDDITWCARECPDKKCERNTVNRRCKRGLFSVADMYKEGECPSEASIEEFAKRMKEYKEKTRAEKHTDYNHCEEAKKSYDHSLTNVCPLTNACPGYKNKQKKGILGTLLENDALKDTLSDEADRVLSGEKPSTEKEIIRKLFDRIAKSQAEMLMKTAFGDYDENAQVKGGMTYGNLRDLEQTAIMYGMLYAVAEL